MGVSDAGVWDTVLSAAEFAPAALLCPMLVMGIGAVVLRRIVWPAAAIEGQLQRLAASPSLSENTLTRVNLPTPAGLGWNRIVESFAGNCRNSNLEARLSRVVDSYREQKAERILNSLSDAIAVTDDNGQITFANKALAGLLGKGTSGDSLGGRTMEECLAVESAGEAAAPLLDAKLRGRTVVVQMNRPGDVPQGILRVARSPQSSAPGESAAGHVWSVRDITQQKLADQMRDQFVNAATHELRTPLANIKAYAETLALSEVEDPEQQKEFCNIINEEVTRLARFVDDLLQLSRMEVGATSLNRQVTDMERLLRETIAKVRPQIQQKRIDLDVQLPGKLPELFVDKDKLIVALVNLLGNAAKYTPEGGSVRLHVEIADDRMQIDVEDTGIGISVEELPRIFDKFYRSSDSRVYDQTGSGLGLSLAHEIIRLHGGKLSVQSELNKGSKFTATLPTVQERA
jgi:PAS domain S-box-containing protein